MRRKLDRLDEISIETWKINEFQDFLLFCCNKVYEQVPMDIWNTFCIIPLPKKGDLSYIKQLSCHYFNMNSCKYIQTNVIK